MDFLDHHRAYRPDCNGKGLLPKEVSRPFLVKIAAGRHLNGYFAGYVGIIL